MDLTIQNAIIAAENAKDKGFHATMGAHMANKNSHKQYLRKHHLGKFAKGKK